MNLFSFEFLKLILNYKLLFKQVFSRCFFMFNSLFKMLAILLIASFNQFCKYFEESFILITKLFFIFIQYSFFLHLNF